MSNKNEGGIGCSVLCWIIGVLLGIATYLVMSGRFGMGAIIALVLAVVVALLVGALLRTLFCNGSDDVDKHPARKEHDIAVSPQSVLGVDSSGAMAPPVPKTAPEATSAESVAKVSKPTSKPSSPVKKTEPKAAKKPKTKETAKPKAAAKTAKKPVAKDGKPEMLTSARDGGADDLKQIKGVGPKLEAMLNKMGFYHFDQLAGWRAKEVKWVDENLEGFKGRVSRDEWVKQAKILAKGGATEFSKKVKKGGVYAKKKT
jgi:predicted flap endonuclease-1-like 5' DNA nuclease/uncharacterized membrane protein YeaQ/YmgE (transglycosylase-associated protein family)